MKCLWRSGGVLVLLEVRLFWVFLGMGLGFVTECFWLGWGLAYYSVRTAYMVWGDVFFGENLYVWL